MGGAAPRLSADTGTDQRIAGQPDRMQKPPQLHATSVFFIRERSWQFASTEPKGDPAMKITPLDIRKQPFRKKLMGLDPDEVNSFLGMVADQYEALIKEKDDLATELKYTGEKLDGYVKIEKTLNQTLLTAQKATDDARVNAQKESELIIKDAQIRAHTYEDESRRRVHGLEGELVTLRNQRDSFLARFKALLKTQLDLLGTISGDLSEAGHSSAARKRIMRAEEDETMAEVAAQPDLTGSGIVV